MKMPAQYVMGCCGSARVREHNQHKPQMLGPKSVSMPVTEVRKMAPMYATGKSQAAPMGKPGMTTTKAD